MSNYRNAAYPSMRDLDVIGRARLHAERMAGSLKPGQAIHLHGDAASALFAWPDEASLCGFERTHEGFAFRGHPVRRAP